MSKQTKPKETCKSGQLEAKYDSLYGMWELEKQLQNEYSYIHEHLMTLHFLVREFNCKNIIEVGTGAGHSTLALALGATYTNGQVVTIDIEQCEEAKDLIEKSELSDVVTFLKIPPQGYSLKGKFDLILIDGNHTQSGVIADIQRFLNQELKPGAFVIFHDTNNPKWKQEVNSAIFKANLISRNSNHKVRKQYFNTYEWLNCNGLTVMRYTGDKP